MIKDTNVTIRMATSHKEKIKSQASKLGLSIGSYLLMLAIEDGNYRTNREQEGDAHVNQRNGI